MSIFLLFGTITFGVALAGVVMIVGKVIGWKPPRWVLPAVAGAGMLTFHIWMEYQWFKRIALQLPPSVEVAEQFTRQTFWQPWTLVVPQVVRFTAVDRRTVSAVGDGLAAAEVLLVDRFRPALVSPQLYDCAHPRRADLTGIDEIVVPPEGAWFEIEPGNPLQRVICSVAGVVWAPPGESVIAEASQHGR